MTDRENLNQIVKRAAHSCLPSNTQALHINLLVTELLASGVVVREWIPVTERLPELIPCNAGTAYSEAVIVWTDGRKAMIAVWDGIDFLCAADYWEAWGENITHWMPLPSTEGLNEE